MEELQKLEDRLRECVAEAWREAPMSHRSGELKVTLAIESIGDRPAAELPTNARILQLVRAADKHLRIESFPVWPQRTPMFLSRSELRRPRSEPAATAAARTRYVNGSIAAIAILGLSAFC